MARLSATMRAAEAKASLNRAFSHAWQTRNRVIYPCSVEKLLDEVRVGVKGQSNSEIARTPRNAFRCSLKPKASRGRATDRMRGLHRLSSPDKLRMLDVRSLGVRAWVLRSVPERRTIRTAG